LGFLINAISASLSFGIGIGNLLRALRNFEFDGLMLVFLRYRNFPPNARCDTFGKRLEPMVTDSITKGVSLSFALRLVSTMGLIS